MTALQPYPAYRASGVEWLGEVPEHWDVRRTKTLLMQRSEKGHPNEPLLAATQTKGVVRKENYESRTVLATKDLHLLKLVRYGDFVISLRSFQGGIEYARERGIISPAYTILFAVQPENHGYLAHLFKSDPYVRSLSLFVTGIRQGQNIDYAALARSRLPLPPIGEQRAIVHFLDYADRRIRRYIRAKERLIELLEEQKQAIIHQAVTGQIDVRTGQPYPAYQASGVEWLGDIPAHWEQCRLRNVVLEVTTGSRGWSRYAADTGPLFVRVANLSRGSLEMRFNDIVRLDLPSTSEAARTRIREGDLLLSVTAYIGSVAVVPVGFEEAYVSQHVARCEPRSEICSRWLGYVLLSRLGRVHGQMSLYGGTKDGLSLDDVKNYPILVPPRDEQVRLVRWIECEISLLGKLRDLAQRQIDLVSAYRTRLIADVVTGKLDVRESAGTVLASRSSEVA